MGAHVPLQLSIAKPSDVPAEQAMNPNVHKQMGNHLSRMVAADDTESRGRLDPREVPDETECISAVISVVTHMKRNAADESATRDMAVIRRKVRPS